MTGRAVRQPRLSKFTGASRSAIFIYGQATCGKVENMAFQVGHLMDNTDQ